jgi:hypothetical protein
LQKILLAVPKILRKTFAKLFSKKTGEIVNFFYLIISKAEERKLEEMRCCKQNNKRVAPSYLQETAS